MKFKALATLAILLASTAANALTWEQVKADLEADGYQVREIRVGSTWIKAEASKGGVEYEFVFDSSAASTTDEGALLSFESDGSDDGDDDDGFELEIESEDDDDHDNSGPGSDDDDHDNSGPGSDGDDDHDNSGPGSDADDHSGSGSGSDDDD